MNNINNIKLSKVSYKLLENDQNKKRIAKVDLANKNYSKNLVLRFFYSQKLDVLIVKELLISMSMHKREREREREQKFFWTSHAVVKNFFFIFFLMFCGKVFN